MATDAMLESYKMPTYDRQIADLPKVSRVRRLRSTHKSLWL